MNGDARGTLRVESWPRGERADTDAAVDALDAAEGDDDAWARLLNSMARSPSVLTLFLLAAAAECRGDVQSADTAWLSLRDDVGRRTGIVLARAAVADIQRALASPRHDARARAVYSNAIALGRVRGGLHRDPRWALDAIRRLENRGDQAGARLLAETLSNTVTDPPLRIVDEVKRLTPEAAMRRYRWSLTFGFVVALGFAWLGILWLLLMGLARMVIDSRVRVPGLSVQDSRAWRSLRPRNIGAGYASGSSALSGWVGLLIYVPVALLAALVAGSVTSSDQSYAVIILIWCTALIAIPVLAVFSTQHAWSWWKAMQARTSDGVSEQEDAVDAARCQCWNTVWQSDGRARLYMGQHLVPVPLEGTLSALAAVSALGTWVAECPVSRIRWLGWQTTPEGGFLAVRGSAAAPPEWAPAQY